MARTSWLARTQADLLAVIGVAVLALVLFGIGDPPLAIRVALVGPLLLALPGYALTVALFPRPAGSGRIDDIERVALTFGLSLAILPLVGVILASTPIGITRRTVVLGIGFTAIVAALVGGARRLQLDPDARFVPRIPARNAGDRAPVAATLTLAVAVCIAIGVLGFAIAMPQVGERTSEIYVLGQEEEGASVASGYPEEVAIDEELALEIGVENDEHRPTSYTVVVLLESFEADGERGDYEELERLSFELDHGETFSTSVEVSPTIVGEDQRLSMLLYEGEPGSYVVQRTAYRHTHIWIDVTE